MLKSIKNRLKTFIFWNRFLMYKILQKKTVFFNLFSKILCFIKKKKKNKTRKTNFEVLVVCKNRHRGVLASCKLYIS